ncbi:5176_t:CDS:2, partial [Scutellospora calospora]
MVFFVVCVLRGTKTIIPDKVIKVLHTESSQFYDIFNIITNNQFEDCVVREIIINEIFTLISSIQKYAKNLEQINQAVKEIHLSKTPACQSANDLKPIHLPDDIFNSLDWLPDPILSTANNDQYAKFQSVYRSTISEQYHPIFITTITNNKYASSSILVNIRVRKFIQYFQCRKIRCLYSKYALSAENKIVCQIAINNWNYSCGSLFVPENHILYDEVFVREKISYETPIELAYYS